MSSDEEYSVPDGFLYTKDHEWVKRKEPDLAIVGITDYAAKMLHDIVYVVLPKVGAALSRKDVFGQAESVKTVSDIYMPVSGKIVKTNEELTKKPETVGNSPYGDGWMLEVQTSNYEVEARELLDSEAYKRYISELKESEK